MKQMQNDFLSKKEAPSTRSVLGFTLATVPTCFACSGSAIVLSLLQAGRLKRPINEVLLEIGILWLVTVVAWMGVFRWLSQDTWFKEYRKLALFGLSTSVLAAPIYQFIQAWSRAAASGIPRDFDIRGAILTAPFWGVIYFCLALLAASWSALLTRSLSKT